MKNNNTLVVLIAVLLIVFLLLLCLASAIGNNDPATGSSESTTQPTVPSTTVQTAPTETTSLQTDPTQTGTTPPETTVPPTVPPTTMAPLTGDPGEYIGSLYTRGYLETLDTKLQGYGAGNEVDSKNRPTYPIRLTEQFKHFDASFIGPDDGNIYITFNCGYEYNNLTSVILDTLKEKNVKVVFFVNMYFVKSNPQLIQRILDEGHALGNHCTNHPDLPNLSIDDIVSEIMEVHNYVEATYGYKMKLFRPPSGYYSEQVLAIAQSLGYHTYNFSFSYADWDPEDLPDPAATLDKLITKAHSGAIYQLHTVSGTNAAIIGPFIDAMRQQGYGFGLLS